ncbi:MULTISPECIES: pentapeptide repeat-containing protein [Trichocoleus]|uniref:Pentapeptide repeat-containing protein n=1 Tax=Trichocoleus desertorum GB2-A4 TaxID=2933944 RepID=A0ABV0J9D9_9CYAN|nr:pentapeptide repeat-containing protein [Trichocoleus sp. FACHB-46]MBD1864774.1 pentapeptide repeat-containing protein [Trichocoleus sp. FACHB-46]
MRVLRPLLGILICLLALVTVPLPTQAASSAAIRAYDDVKSVVKDFSGQDLAKAEFSNAKLVEANFSNANLQGAVFNGSIAKKANFHGADFSNGIAYLSDFSGVDLSDAVLTSAMLLKTNFRGAKITGADFSFAVLDRNQLLEMCKSASGTNPVTGIDTRDSLECS